MRILFWIAILLLGGCTAIKLGYNNADTALRWMADDYLALEKPQEELLRTRLDGLLAWHRATALRQYADMLREVKSKVAAGLGRDDILWLIDATRAEYDQVLDRAAIEAAGLLTTISTPQIANLEKKFARDNAKFSKEHLRGSAEDQRERRAEKTLERIEHWVGRLSDAQQTRITALSDAIPLTDELWRQDRVRKQQEFVALLRDRQNAAGLEASLRQWLANWQHGKSAEYQRASDEFQDQSVALVLAVDSMITPVQRARAVAKVQSYIDDLEELAAAPRKVRGDQPAAPARRAGWTGLAGEPG